MLACSPNTWPLWTKVGCGVLAELSQLRVSYTCTVPSKPEMARQPSRAGAQETHRNSAPQLGEGMLHFAEAKGSEVFLTSVRVRWPLLERQAMGWELGAEPGAMCPAPMHHRSPPGAQGTDTASKGPCGCRTSPRYSCPLAQHRSNVLQSRNARPLSSSLLLEAAT